MIDDVSDIAAFYNGDKEQEHGRLKQSQLEYDLTWRYLDEYLPSQGPPSYPGFQGSILEIGAATGRYTCELARRGYTVTAVDLSPVLINECRKNITEKGLEKQVRFFVADARNPGQITEKGFDVVLLMGPLYHLLIETDRKAAIKEAFHRLKKGGIIFTSFLSRFGIIGDVLKRAPGWIEDKIAVQSLIEKGKRPDHYPRGGFRGYFAEVAEMAPLHEAIGFKTLAIAGVDPAISADDESYNKLQGKQRRLWLDLFYKISKEKSIIGASRHLLYIGRKK
jgi:S-adenosylmethionine-dependent methyltransferase